MIARLSAPDARSLLTADKSADADALRAELLGIRERLEALAVDFADGSLTSAQLRTATERLRSREGAIELQLADAGRVDVLGDLVGAKDVRTTWEALSLARKRAVIDTLAVVTLHAPGRGTRTFRPETVGIDWKA